MFILEECTVESINKAFAGGELTSYELTLMYLDRIAKIDQSGPKLNSVLEVNPDALFIAAAMDRERAAGKIRSSLHGIPIILKDNINTHDKMRTSAGSLALDDNFATYDAHLVKRLRDAGLVILGKANMTELANFMAYAMNGGYSSRGGQVLNPYKADAPVYGSSGGSAVAVSANICALAIGTETNGSIIAPSFINGTTGIKPTMGLVSRHGIIPICGAQDTAGPMTRTVADSAALLNIIAGSDESDPATWCIDTPEDYTAFLKIGGLKGMRVGINYFKADKENKLRSFDDELQALSKAAINTMADCGAEIIDDAYVSMEDRIDLNVMLYEYQKHLNAYLATTSPGNKVRSLKQMIDYYGDHPKESLKYGMGRLLDAQYTASGNLADPEYIEARLNCIKQSRTDGLDRVFDELSLDVLVCPMFSGLSPISGYPSICIPAGYKSDGTPYGITIIARPFDEKTLIAAAYDYEQASKMRKAPVFGL